MYKAITGNLVAWFDPVQDGFTPTTVDGPQRSWGVVLYQLSLRNAIASNLFFMSLFCIFVVSVVLELLCVILMNSKEKSRYSCSFLCMRRQQESLKKAGTFFVLFWWTLLESTHVNVRGFTWCFGW